MRRLIFATMLAATSLSMVGPAAAQSPQAEQRFDAAQARYDRETQLYQQELRRYRQSIARYGDYRQGGGPGYPPPPPGAYPGPGAYNDDRDEGGYDPSRYYRSGQNYQERQLAADDRVYRGSDGRYYCKRNDGTTGLIVGAVGGGILGNIIDGGHSRAVGTLLGGALGAFAGKSIDQSNSQITCR